VNGKLISRMFLPGKSILANILIL